MRRHSSGKLRTTREEEVRKQGQELEASVGREENEVVLGCSQGTAGQERAWVEACLSARLRLGSQEEAGFTAKEHRQIQALLPFLERTGRKTRFPKESKWYFPKN